MWPKYAHRSSLPTLPSHACAARVCVVRVSLHDPPVCSRLRSGPGSPSSSLDPCLVAYTTLPRVEGTAHLHTQQIRQLPCTALLRCVCTLVRFTHHAIYPLPHACLSLHTLTMHIRLPCWHTLPSLMLVVERAILSVGISSWPDQDA